ncbi:MAG: HAD family phosphatase [Clostridium sp.]|nr:HAD family phosphatase [Clostridium sp.]
MKEGIKNVVFDVGMVLIDFCWEKHCRNLGFDDGVIAAFDVNMIRSGYWDMLDEGSITTQDAIDKFMEAMPEYKRELELFWASQEGFVEEYAYSAPLVRELKAKGYKVYLLSNYPLDMYRLHWPSFEFYKLVDGYVVSAPEKIKKPDPAIYHLLCERFGLKAEECMFIDDRQENVDTAVKVGMEAAVFTGYGKLREILFD